MSVQPREKSTNRKVQPRRATIPANLNVSYSTIVESTLGLIRIDASLRSCQ
jgi:hypothetical protein